MGVAPIWMTTSSILISHSHQLKTGPYCAATKLREGNIFSHGCLFIILSTGESLLHISCPGSPLSTSLTPTLTHAHLDAHVEFQSTGPLLPDLFQLVHCDPYMQSATKQLASYWNVSVRFTLLFKMVSASVHHF